MAVFFPSTEVRWREVDGTLVLLVLSSGRYLVLDDVAAAIWRAVLVHNDVHGIEAALAQRYEAPPEKLRIEVDRFLRRGLAAGILQTHPPAVLPPTLRRAPRRLRFSLVRAAVELIRARRSIAKDGFGASYARLSLLAKPNGETNDPRRLDKLVRAFIRAEAVVWLKHAPHDCLVRSMALYRLLLSHGIDVKHHIGVRLSPFLAHAWVTYRDQPILEHPRLVEQFKPIAQL